MSATKRVFARIDWLIGTVNEYTGRIISFFVLIMSFTIFCDVLMRKLFSRPIFWALEVNMYMLALLVMLGGGYTLLHDGHVKVDLVFDRLPPKAQAILDGVTYLLFFAFAGVLLWKGWQMAGHSLQVREVSPEATGIPIFPSKLAIPIGGALILLQGLSKYVKNIARIITGKHQTQDETNK